MCLILLANRVSAEYPLIIAANRDEFYSRSSAPLDEWKDRPGLYAGRDLVGGGTWMGVTRTGRFAAVTNYRDPKSLRPNTPSRGSLVSDYLSGDESPPEYVEKLVRHSGRYNGFNLLLGQGETLLWYSNRGSDPAEIAPGIHGLSNALLNTPWPKVVQGKRELQKVLEKREVSPIDSILELLQDSKPFADADLPTTGVGVEWERILSSLFIKSPGYGTRSSSVLLFAQTGTITFVEQTYNDGKKTNSPVHLVIHTRQT